MTKKAREYLADYLCRASDDILLEIYNGYVEECQMSNFYENDNENLKNFFADDIKGFVNLINSSDGDYDVDCKYFAFDDYGIISSDSLFGMLNKICGKDFVGSILDAYERKGDLTKDAILNIALKTFIKSKSFPKEEKMESK